MLPADTLTEVAGPAMRGAAVRPDDAAYEGLRRVHNAMIDRRPALIAQVADADDIASALAHARAHGLPVSVRGGGHAATGHAIADGGVVIDTRALKAINVRVASRTVTAGAGVTWGELDAMTQEHGLAVTGARVPSVGVVGFTTGSGSGWLERVMGLAADNLLSARVVAADGREVTASDREHPELFWALRGGGGNFGVVTELTFGAMPLGPTVLGGMRLYAMDRAHEVITAYRGVMDDAPEALCGGLAMITAPPAPHIPPQLHGRPVVAVIALWAGDPEDAWSGIERLDALGEPLAELVSPCPTRPSRACSARAPASPPRRCAATSGSA
jgi:FAD/FMN-containing dehydrogenase